MRYAELFEDPDKDIAFSLRTQAAYRAFSQYVYNATDYDNTVESKEGNLLGFDTRKFGGSEIFGVDGLLIAVGKRKGYRIGAAYTQFERPVKGFKDFLIFNATREEPTFDNVKSSVNSVEFMGVFKHEMVHVFDNVEHNDAVLRNVGYKADENDRVDLKQYFNSPWEFNAYYHMIADRFAGIVREIDGLNRADAAEIADFMGYSGNFSTDLATGVRDFSHGRAFMQHLTEPRRRALLRRLYQLHARVGALIAAAPEADKLAA